MDEFHALGRPATIALARLASVTADDHVLDVGAGIGGPARFLATRYGARVTALDATPRFLRIAEALTEGTGLTGRVRLIQGDALGLPFDDGAFDLVWTQAVAQNIADKDRFIAELARVVAPGGRVAMFELINGPNRPVEFPVPWANGPEESWVASGAELRALLTGVGLHIREWRQDQEAIAAIAEAARTEPAPTAPETLGLQLLMPDYEARMAGLARNVEGRRIVLVQIVAERPR